MDNKSLFHRDSVVFMMRDGKMICPICGTELEGDKCPECEWLTIESDEITEMLSVSIG